MAIKSARHLGRMTGVTKAATPGERIFGKMFPNRTTTMGGWSGDRLNYVQHMTDWTYVAINTIWSKCAGIMPNLAYVSDIQKPGLTMKAGDRGLRGNGRFGGSSGIGFGTNSQTFMTVGEYYSKALSVVKPHEELEPLESDHLLRRLIENPNPMDTSYDLLYEWGMYLELCGISYLWAIPNALGKPCELWVLPAHWVFPRTGIGKLVESDDPNAQKIIEYYEVRPISLGGGLGSNGVLEIPAGEVVVARHKSPINKIDGYSRLWAISRWIDTQESISKSRWAQFINQARPEFWVEMGPGYSDPDDNMIARLEAKIAAKHQGEMNYGKPIFTPAGAKVTPLSFSPTEMAYQGSMEEVRDSILCAFGVPKSAVGIVSDMTYGSILATLMSFCEQAINPRLAMLGQTLTKQLASRWDDDGRKCRLWWDNCSPADPAQVNSDIGVDLQAYAITPDEVRAIRGRKPYKIAGNNPLVQGPGGIVPLPINVEEEADDLSELVAQYAGKFAEATGGEQQEQSGQELPNEGGEQLDEYAQEMESLTDPTIEEPNGPPSKQAKGLAEDRAQVTLYKRNLRKYSTELDKLLERGAPASSADAVKYYARIRHLEDMVRMTGNALETAEQAVAATIEYERKPSKQFKRWCAKWTKRYGGHSYSSTQFNLEGDALTTIKEVQSFIKDEHLTSKGKEDIPHVTIRYGLEGSDAGPVRQLVETFGPVELTIGQVDYFPAEDHDVLILRVESEKLRRLNELLDELPNVQTHPEYQPHITLAYVQPGMGEEYVELLERASPDEQGIWFDDPLEFTQLVFSPKDGTPAMLDLASHAFAEKRYQTKSTAGDKVKQQRKDYCKPGQNASRDHCTPHDDQSSGSSGSGELEQGEAQALSSMKKMEYEVKQDPKADAKCKSVMQRIGVRIKQAVFNKMSEVAIKGVDQYLFEQVAAIQAGEGSTLIAKAACLGVAKAWLGMKKLATGKGEMDENELLEIMKILAEEGGFEEPTIEDVRKILGESTEE